MIRRYGPGKFNTILDSLLYSLSLDGGPDEEAGDAETFGYYGLMRGPFTEEDIRRLEEIAKEQKEGPLTDDEKTLLRESKGGAILSEDSAGHVHVEWFDTKREADKAWAEVEREWEKFSEEVEAEEGEAGENPLGPTATMVYTDERGYVTVRYQATPVVRFNDREIVLDSGGWRTATTKKSMNEASEEFRLGFEVVQKARDWHVRFKGGVHPFQDGMVLVR